MNPASNSPQSAVEVLWPFVVSAVFGLSLLNFAAAAAIAFAGRDIHPLFSDPHAWMFFAVTGVGLFAQAVMMLAMSHYLWGEGDGRNRNTARVMSFVRLPLTGAYATARLRARQRIAGHRERPRRSAWEPIFRRP